MEKSTYINLFMSVSSEDIMPEGSIAKIVIDEHKALSDEIERLREEKEILKIALQNIKECIAHKGEAEKDRDEMADYAYIVTAIVIGLGSVR